MSRTSLPEKRAAGGPRRRGTAAGARLLAGALLLAALAACTERLAPPGPGATAPHLELQRLTDQRAAADFVASDGLKLPLRAWLPGTAEGDGAPAGLTADGQTASAAVDGGALGDPLGGTLGGDPSADPRAADEPKAVVLALHGFNDHSAAFTDAAPAFVKAGIALYAYDQRGFGAGPNRGLWAGSERMADDARTALRLLARRYPGKPLYLLGESMGGAVALLAASGPDPPPIDGVVLAAPAVWSSDLQPWYQRWALWLAVRLVPGLRPSGQGNNIQASDNIEALKALGRDPLVIKYTRVDTLQGLVDLMGKALEAAPGVKAPVLLLYGEHDELIPEKPVEMLWHDLPKRPDTHLVVYPKGWHLLLRDLQAPVVYDDITAWIAHPALPPPSLVAGLADRGFDAK
ncbi:Lysophospholipase, alpha-beta hydrolase superfamily [Tistlia consotensis]|uniref:Lysophospholipase, alpha-beta hydrolase superfamily n=1 Tax=Tistlia consotensis USBA 355 TaxID=560819 RepID=A0A1Y6CN23_9PROT|nr:alpha/beta hydrolase [Tistlia consotensis]SMF63383.1 Lysophospholipase, alpha-beta hydrolase superfamily [Tistlia consotensis USBA 355]SNR96095.1 Lysophospholipase, alpha-beta hydrolase superfamily [Tistlia consotensis]